MKYLILIGFCSLFFAGFSQTARYGQLEKGQFLEYVTQAGQTITCGDTLTIGMPTAPNGFKFITQANVMAGNFIAGDRVTVNKLKTYGNKKRGYKMFAVIKGYGLMDLFIDIEPALKSGELEKIP